MIAIAVPWFETGITTSGGNHPDQSVAQQQIDALPSPQLLKTHLSFHRSTASNPVKMAVTVNALPQHVELTEPVHIVISDNSSPRPFI